MASSDFQVTGKNTKALFTLKLHRGDGMCLLAMNWKTGKPPNDFVGFAIESRPPGGDTFFPLTTASPLRRRWRGQSGPALDAVSPIQKFRWVHFPRNANLDGAFTYRVTPIFMDEEDRLSQGEPQEADIELRRETYPGQVNVTFTRGSSPRRRSWTNSRSSGAIKTLLPATAKAGLTFKADASQEGRGARLDGLRGARDDPGPARSGHQGEGRRACRRLRSQRAGGRGPA